MWQSFSSNSEEIEKAEVKNMEKNNENIIIDLNPNNFEKPKDHLFFNFFAMYAKKSVDPPYNLSAIKSHQLDGLALEGENKDSENE